MLGGLAKDLIEKNALILDAGGEEVSRKNCFCHAAADVRKTTKLIISCSSPDSDINFSLPVMLVTFYILYLFPGSAKGAQDFPFIPEGVARQESSESNPVHERTSLGN